MFYAKNFWSTGKSVIRDTAHSYNQLCYNKKVKTKRIAVISDIHGNYEALHSVLTHISTQKTDAIICLEDIVGYGPDPDLCISSIQETSSITVRGNHEEALASTLHRKAMNLYAQKAIHWTDKVLTPEHYSYIMQLPKQAWIAPGICMVHSSLYNPDWWNYIFTEQDALLCFRAEVFTMCFVGHTHIPALFDFDRKNAALLKKHIPPYHKPYFLEPDKRYIANPGSVGQPRDRNPDASYIILTVSIKDDYQNPV